MKKTEVRRARREQSQRGEKLEEGSRVSGEKSQKRKDQKKEDAGVRKGRKVAKHCVFANGLLLRKVEK
jgi:hypothetical protein